MRAKGAHINQAPKKQLGVLGGMGPAATADFLRLLAEMAPARRDQDHPRMFVYSHPQIPDRTEALLRGGPDPTPALEQGLRMLADWGADVLAVPCNTAHHFIDSFSERLPVPVIHIVESTVAAAARMNPSGAWLAASTGTVASGVYERWGRRFGYPLLIPGQAEQDRIHEVIYLVKAGELARAGSQIADVAQRLWEQHDLPVIAGCTEIPIAWEHGSLPPTKMVSSLEALADACLKALYAD